MIGSLLVSHGFVGVPDYSKLLEDAVNVLMMFHQTLLFVIFWPNTILCSDDLFQLRQYK